MVETLTVLLVFVVIAMIAVWRRGQPEIGTDPASEFDVEAISQRPLVRNWSVVPWTVAIAVPVTLNLTLDMVWWIAAAIGIVFGVAVAILFGQLAQRRVSMFEFQLADSLDLMVSTMRAGGSVTEAMVTAARESRRPLSDHLLEMVERIRLGERPESVLTSLEERVPLESLRLFTFALAAHWQGGGSLAATLSNVGRTIRDRVDVSRRVSSQAVETQASVIGVMAVTYGLAILMWINYPDRVKEFADSELGSMFIGVSILLQGIGLFWISRMTRIEV